MVSHLAFLGEVANASTTLAITTYMLVNLKRIPFPLQARSNFLSVYKRPGACGETTCEDLKGTVTCHNGEVTGDTDYLFDSCDGTACPCEDAPGGLLHSGESRSVARMVDGETVKNEVYCYDTVLYRQEYPNLPVDIPRK